MNHVHGSDVLSWCAGAGTQIVLYVFYVPPIVYTHRIHVHGSDVLSWCAGAETQIVLYVAYVPLTVQAHIKRPTMTGGALFPDVQVQVQEALRTYIRICLFLRRYTSRDTFKSGTLFPDVQVQLQEALCRYKKCYAHTYVHASHCAGTHQETRV